MAKKKMSVMEEVEEAKKLVDFVTEVNELFGGKLHKDSMWYEYKKKYTYCTLVVRINRNKSSDFDNVTATFILTDGRVAGLAKNHCVVKDAMSVEFVKDCIGLAKVVDESMAKFFSGLVDSIYRLNEVDYGRGEDN